MSDQPKPATGESMIWNGDCKVKGCERECVDSSGYCKKHKPATCDEAYNELARSTPREARSPFSSKLATGEWTVETVEALVAASLNPGWTVIADAHNAALADTYEQGVIARELLSHQQLAAERESLRKLGEQYKDEIHSRINCEQQLAAERSLCETAQSNAELWHEEMLKADKQLAAEREKVQTLVDALDEVERDTTEKNIQQIAQRALAKAEPRSTRVKEGK